MKTTSLLAPERGAPAMPPCIGVFDSGVGGLTILRALHQRLPGTPMIYVGDVSHAPYGQRSATEVIARSTQIVQWLADQGAQMIVVACNTATVLTIEALRARWPRVVFVGVEPGVKPAAARSRMRRIAVMATTATAASERLRHLIARYAADAHVHVQPCHDLASVIERGVLTGPALLEVLQPYCDAILAAPVDTVVLGCTHYAFVEDSIRSLLGPGITLIDTATAVAERTASLWEQLPPLFIANPAVRVTSTGAPGTMQLLLARCQGLETTEVEPLTL
jgi:glutamate racemase